MFGWHSVHWHFLFISAASDLDSIRALFNEKEKELSLAVAKVEELTRQLEELKRGRGATAREQQQQAPSPAALELDKLRRELMVCFNILFYKIEYKP